MAGGLIGHPVRVVMQRQPPGGGVGIGIDLKYQTLFDQPLHLTPDERKDLVAFLRALTDTVTRQ